MVQRLILDVVEFLFEELGIINLLHSSYGLPSKDCSLRRHVPHVFGFGFLQVLVDFHLLEIVIMVGQLRRGRNGVAMVLIENIEIDVLELDELGLFLLIYSLDGFLREAFGGTVVGGAQLGDRNG